MSKSPKCGTYYCANRTADPSGRCHHHRHDYRAGYAADGSLLPSSPPPPPAPRTVRRSNGEEIEEWTENGKTTREGGPAKTERYPNGMTKTESYYESGELHRLDGPAVVEYRNDGSIYRESYRYRGELHRLDGPSITVFQHGKPPEEAYHLRDRSFTNREHLYGALARWPEKKVASEVRASPYRPLLREGHTGKQVVAVLAQGVKTLDGIRQVLEGTPVPWVLAYEAGEVRA